MIKAFRFEDSQLLIANTYVLGRSGQPCIIIDMGDPNDEIIKYIQTAHTKVEAILLTHGHYDHIRGIDRFLSKYGDSVPVYMSKEDFSLITDAVKNGSAINQERVSMASEPVFVKDGQTLSFGETKIKVIATPFHTPGSVCYLSAEDNALFTGDTLFRGSIGRTDFPESMPEMTYASLKKLAQLPDLLVCYPGHGEITTLGAEKRSNPFLLGAM